MKLQNHKMKFLTLCKPVTPFEVAYLLFYCINCSLNYYYETLASPSVKQFDNASFKSEIKNKKL